jgi:hypothetical protein
MNPRCSAIFRLRPEGTVPGVSDKVLIQQLKELEADRVLAGTDYKEVPPRGRNAGPIGTKPAGLYDARGRDQLSVRPDDRAAVERADLGRQTKPLGNPQHPARRPRADQRHLNDAVAQAFVALDQRAIHVRDDETDAHPRRCQRRCERCMSASALCGPALPAGYSSGVPCSQTSRSGCTARQPLSIWSAGWNSVWSPISTS